MYDLGIIGGMGPLASADIYKRIIERTKVDKDQDHLSIVILNKPTIPDRTNAIINNDLSIVDSLNEAINELEKLNVANFIMACNTVHYFVNKLNIPKTINFISLIDEVLLKLKIEHLNKPIYILSTTGTKDSNIYKLNEHAKDLNINYPTIEESNVIMDYIYEVKSGLDSLRNISKLESVLNNIQERSLDAVFVLACTELSMATSYLSKKYNIVDAVDVLVDSIIIKCGYKLKK